MTTFVGCTMTTRLFTVRGHKQVLNALNRETMETIRDQFWPFHFMTEAFSRYGSVFEKRSAKYMRRKAAVKRHQRPNEWSGALRVAVLTTSKVRATSTRGTLVAKAPATTTITHGPYGNIVYHRPLTEQRRREMEIVSADETRLLIERQQARYIESTSDPRFIDVVRQRM